jgi:hypothetical protein
MSQLNRQDLKLGFTAGTQATSAKFGDFIDSAYNRTDDSVLAGPSGQTGANGLWFNNIGATPATLTSAGTTGQFAADESGAWICIGINKWIRLA